MPDSHTNEGRYQYERPVRVVKANETPVAKMDRLAEAIFRAFVKADPDRAKELMRKELAVDMLK